MTEWPTARGSTPRPSGERRTPRSRPRRPLLPQVLELIAIIAFLFVSYEALLWAWTKTAPKEVQVPAILGLQQQEAVTLLEAAGLRLEVVAEKSSEEAPEDGVISCDPAPGRRVKAGRTIRLTVSSGSRWSKVPDVSDMSVDRAIALLREAKLTVRKQRTRYDAKVPVGYILSQAPAAGAKVARGTEVEILVSKGPRPETEIAGETPPPEGTRSTEIELTVPPGASLQEVKVVVRDKQGEREVYRANHEPGETIKRSVSGQGTTIVVQVYLSGLLVQEKSI